MSGTTAAADPRFMFLADMVGETGATHEILLTIARCRGIKVERAGRSFFFTYRDGLRIVEEYRRDHMADVESRRPKRRRA